MKKSLNILAALILSSSTIAYASDTNYTVNTTFNNFPSGWTNEACAQDSKDLNAGKYCQDTVDNGKSTSTNNTSAYALQPGFLLQDKDAAPNITIKFDTNCASDWFELNGLPYETSNNTYSLKILAPKNDILNDLGPYVTFNMQVNYELDSSGNQIAYVNSCVFN